MPEAVLAGENGQPAIDQLTGMPLTMEELLRRRGYVGVAGVPSAPEPVMLQPVAVNGASAAEQALADAEAAAQAAQVAGGSVPTANGSLADGTTTLPSGSGVPPPLDTQQTVTSVDDPNYLPWLAAGAGAAALYGASKLRRNPVTGIEEIVQEGSPDAARAMTARRVGPTVNDSLTREPGSNRQLSTLVDGKNVARAGEIGAGPKRLSGPAPVTDVSNEAADALADRRGSANEGRLPNRVGSTKPRNAAIRNNRMVNNPIRPPMAENSAVLEEAINRVRALKAQGFPMNKILPRAARMAIP